MVKVELAESTGEERADPLSCPPTRVPTCPTGAEASLHSPGQPPSRAHRLMAGPGGRGQLGWLLLNNPYLKYSSRHAPNGPQTNIPGHNCVLYKQYEEYGYLSESWQLSTV